MPEMEMLNNISKEWLDIINTEELKQVEDKIKIDTNSILCPPKSLWFEWARLTPLNSIKVIIIGQDSYYTKDTAHGLAFSSLGKKIPPSLQNIYKCLYQQGLIEEMPTQSNLTNWAKQGVLLLNAALSTELGIANKHSHIWEPYTMNLMEKISDYGKKANTKFTYMLWGNFAKKCKEHIDTEWHEVLEWLHPSPLAQSRAPLDKKFINCPHFKRCSEKYGIDWSIHGNIDLFRIDKAAPIKAPARIEVIDYKLIDDPAIIQVFTDGSCKNNGKKNAVGGFAAIFVGGALKGKKLMGKLKSNPSNIRAEAFAIINVFERLKKLDAAAWTSAIIYTDSEFWINMVNIYMPKWRDDKFDKQKNSDITKRLWKLWNLFTVHKLELRYVPAHNKSNWKNSYDDYELWCYKHNEEVDLLAGKALFL
jgi:uracil-DNA glycosylase